ncbi:hypothetical protein BGZ98_001258 [Dissophora globulifera]|nr:hypothetical protein BGZ98_001258 [Dissophora globulifera]
MKEQVGAAVAKIMGKRNSNAELVEEERETARGQLLSAKRLPTGIMGKMMDLAKETLGREDLEVNALGRRTGDAEYRLHEWRVTLRSHVYDEAWDTAVQVDDDDDDEVSRSDNDVDRDSTRTCTATLRQTMRNDVLPHFDRIVTFAEDAQTIERETLPPFAALVYIPPIPVIATNYTSRALETFSPQTSIDDATGAPTNVSL